MYIFDFQVIQSRAHNMYHNHHPSDGLTAATGGGFPYPSPSQTGPVSTTIATGTQVPFSINHMNAAAGVGRNPHIQLPPLHNFGESASQVYPQINNLIMVEVTEILTCSKILKRIVPFFFFFQVSTFWEDDLQTVVQMGFGQNQSENIHGQ